MRIIHPITGPVSCLFLLLSSLIPLQGQELLVNVSVDGRQIQGDKQIFDDMEQNISRYINFQRWGGDQFEAFERVRCNLQIIVNARPSADKFNCTANLIVYRPVLNSTYETITLNISDPEFNFNYVPQQQMQFFDNVFNDNLTALLNFYAYIILGFDYDSFSNNGGDPFFKKAFELVSIASTASQDLGWRSNENQRNRFWLIENITNSRYSLFHDVMYTYHRQGLDLMDSNAAKGRISILKALENMQELSEQNPLLRLIRMFLDAKDDELVGIFGKAFPADQNKFLELMNDLDPSNMKAYESIRK